jgi:hypothetical protein
MAFGVVKASGFASLTRFDHYLPLGDHFVLFGKHDLAVYGSLNDSLHCHLAGVEMPIGWVESGIGQLPFYLNFASYDLYAGVSEGLLPRDMFYGLANSIFQVPPGWHGFGGMDFNMSWTLAYNFPVKFKVGFLIGTFGFVPNLSIELGLYNDYHSARYLSGLRDAVRQLMDR